jgi:hypothetical protein
MSSSGNADGATSRAVELSPRLSLWRAKTAPRRPTAAKSVEPRSERSGRIYEENRRCPRGGFPFSKPWPQRGAHHRYVISQRRLLWIAGDDVDAPPEPGWRRRSPGAMRCKPLRHCWHRRQGWHFRICNLRHLKGRVGFESHPLRHSLDLARASFTTFTRFARVRYGAEDASCADRCAVDPGAGRR